MVAGMQCSISLPDWREASLPQRGAWSPRARQKFSVLPPPKASKENSGGNAQPAVLEDIWINVCLQWLLGALLQREKRLGAPGCPSGQCSRHRHSSAWLTAYTAG